jgi:hypothetical protein
MGIRFCTQFEFDFHTNDFNLGTKTDIHIKNQWLRNTGTIL